MGISYYKCAYCKDAGPECWFGRDINLPGAYETEYDVCNDCADELFALDVPTVLGPNYCTATYYLKENDVVNSFSSFDDMMKFIEENNQNNFDDLYFDVVYNSWDGEDLTPSEGSTLKFNETLDSLKEWMPKKEVWKKRELERMLNLLFIFDLCSIY